MHILNAAMWRFNGTYSDAECSFNCVKHSKGQRNLCGGYYKPLGVNEARGLTDDPLLLDVPGRGGQNTHTSFRRDGDWCWIPQTPICSAWTSSSIAPSYCPCSSVCDMLMTCLDFHALESPEKKKEKKKSVFLDLLRVPPNIKGCLGSPAGMVVLPARPSARMLAFLFESPL